MNKAKKNYHPVLKLGYIRKNVDVSCHNIRLVTKVFIIRKMLNYEVYKICYPPSLIVRVSRSQIIFLMNLHTNSHNNLFKHVNV